MSLFKSQILDNYNLMQYQNDFLLLHCSRNDVICAPFSGKVEATEDGCILYNDYFKLYISHMECDADQEVFAGQTIGVPKMGKISGENLAYIGLKLSYMDKLCDVLIYLHYRDEDIHVSKKIDEETEKEAEETSKPKRKSNRKKK